MEKMNFEQIVSSAVALQGRPFEMRACPDQYLGALYASGEHTLKAC